MGMADDADTRLLHDLHADALSGFEDIGRSTLSCSNRRNGFDKLGESLECGINPLLYRPEFIAKIADRPLRRIDSDQRPLGIIGRAHARGLLIHTERLCGHSLDDIIAHLER